MFLTGKHGNKGIRRKKNPIPWETDWKNERVIAENTWKQEENKKFKKVLTLEEKASILY